MKREHQVTGILGQDRVGCNSLHRRGFLETSIRDGAVIAVTHGRFARIYAYDALNQEVGASLYRPALAPGED